MANLPTDYKNLKLTDIMPVNIARDKTVFETSRAIDIELHKIASIVDELYLMNKIDRLPEDVINLLAWQWHVDFYDESLTLEQKRQLVKSSVSWHKVKGTKKAIEMVCDIVYGESEIKEWFEYGGTPYFFKIYIYGASMRQEELKRIWKMINVAKNVRSWLEELMFMRKMHSNRYIGAFPFVNKIIEIFPKNAEDSETNSCRFAAFTPGISKIIEVLPKTADDAEMETNTFIGAYANMYKEIEIIPQTISDSISTTDRHVTNIPEIYKEFMVKQKED